MQLRIAGLLFHHHHGLLSFWVDGRYWNANLQPVHKALKDAGIRFAEDRLECFHLPLKFKTEDDLNMAIMMFGE